MALQDRLDELKAKAKQRIPAETWAVMEKAIAELQSSGIVDHVVKVGQPAPSFVLPTTRAGEVSLTGLLQRAPVVLSFYRGRW